MENCYFHNQPNFWLRGQEGADLESWETMFQNFGARYYDGQIGRWHAPDPAWVGFSPYEYCHGNPAGMIYSFFAMSRKEGINPGEWLADVLSRIQVHPSNQIEQLLPCNWKKGREPDAQTHPKHFFS